MANTGHPAGKGLDLLSQGLCGFFFTLSLGRISDVQAAEAISASWYKNSDRVKSFGWFFLFKFE